MSLVNCSNLTLFEPHKIIWKSCVPYRVKVFVWLVIHGKVNTFDLVQKRNPNMALSPAWCVLCRKDNESIDHLLIHCQVANGLWAQLRREAGVLGALPEKCKGLLMDEVIGFGSNKMARVMWRAMVMSLMWSLWLERNARIFSAKEMCPQDVFEKAKFLASLWASTDKAFKGFPFSLIVNNWRDIIGR